MDKVYVSFVWNQQLRKILPHGALSGRGRDGHGHGHGHPADRRPATDAFPFSSLFLFLTCSPRCVMM